MKGRSASKIKLTSYDELLGGGEETNDIQQVSLEHLHSFENHPFQVNDDEAMAELVESVKEEGILTALLYDRWVMVNMKSSPVTEGDMRHNLLVLKRFRLLSEIWIKIQLSVRW